MSVISLRILAKQNLIIFLTYACKGLRGQPAAGSDVVFLQSEHKRAATDPIWTVIRKKTPSKQYS